jgi:hypothetical protein
MTNKIPVVGKRYKGDGICFPSEVICMDITYSHIRGVIINCQSQWDNSFRSYEPDLFWKAFEELPEDNLQKQEEVPEVASKDFMEGYNAGWNDFGFKKDYRFKEPADNEPKVNETPNLVDFEKGEVNKVERALEELKDVLNLIKITGPIKHTHHEWFYEKAINLVIALEAEKKSRACETNKIGMSQDKNDEKQAIFAHPLESKTEPKIDMKKERVEPVSIWKNVSELPEGLVDEGIVEWKRGGYSLGMTAHGRFLASAGNVVSSGESVAKFTSLADFINSFEQMQKDIEELKRK